MLWDLRVVVVFFFQQNCMYCISDEQCYVIFQYSQCYGLVYHVLVLYVSIDILDLLKLVRGKSDEQNTVHPTCCKLLLERPYYGKIKFNSDKLMTSPTAAKIKADCWCPKITPILQNVQEVHAKVFFVVL